MGRKNMLKDAKHRRRKRNAGQCTVKRAYSFAEASLLAGRKFRAYKCEIGEHWHLTTKREARRR